MSASAMSSRCTRVLTVLAVLALGVVPARAATDEAHAAKARQMSESAIAYLRTQQDASGGWAVPPAGSNQPALPAISALVLNGMLMHPGIGPDDDGVRRATDYILAAQQPSGAIYDSILPSYNTAICVSALARVNTPRAREGVEKGVAFLRSMQWGEGAIMVGQTPENPAGVDGAMAVDAAHPFYGGVGYGRHGRPDLSNLSFFIQAMHDAGVPREDPALQRAVVFLQRVQMQDEFNDRPWANSSRQGGFIYATATKGDSGFEGQSFAGEIEESLDDGSRVSRLRAYGSMTYAGFKSYLYAGLTRDDPRVLAALRWIGSNYTLDENPGLGTDGMYYYYVTFARALSAYGEPTLVVSAPTPPPPLSLPPPKLPRRSPHAATEPRPLASPPARRNHCPTPRSRRPPASATGATTSSIASRSSRTPTALSVRWTTAGWRTTRCSSRRTRCWRSGTPHRLPRPPDGLLSFLHSRRPLVLEGAWRRQSSRTRSMSCSTRSARRPPFPAGERSPV